MASRISHTTHIFKRLERPLVTPYLRLHGHSQTVRLRCGSVKHLQGHHLGFTTQRKYAGESASRPQDFRYISFPNTRKGRKAEREAYEYWSTFWKSIPEAKKTLVFKIDDRKPSASPGLIDVSREGIVFPAGDKRGERYWRLDHPLSLSEKLQKLRTWFYDMKGPLPLSVRLRNWFYDMKRPSLPLSVRLRTWLYGGPSLPLSAKLQWLVTGPSSQPWSKRSRWIRWPIYGLFYTMLLALIIVGNTMETVPLTGRRRINLSSNSNYAHLMEYYRKHSSLELLRKKFTTIEPLAEPQFSQVNGIIERILIACGLQNLVMEMYLIKDQGKHQIAGVATAALFHI